MRAFRVSVRHTVSHESRVICDVGACVVPCMSGVSHVRVTVRLSG